MEKLNNFHYIAVLLDLMYGIEMDDEDLEELGLLAWEDIGNKNTKLYKYQACPDLDNSITLPCNASYVEAVTSSFEDWNRVTNYSTNGDLNSAFIENHLEELKIFKSPYYISGKYINYELVGDVLYFQKNYGTLNILYKGIFSDEEGLPYLSNKEAKAIATYIAYVLKYKEGLKTNNTVIINLASSLELKWLKQCDLARVTSLNLNDMNLIINIKNCWDRPNYGMSYKPFK